jgi:hypothetical protein
MQAITLRNDIKPLQAFENENKYEKANKRLSHQLLGLSHKLRKKMKTIKQTYEEHSDEEQ